jgi:hypothetical protein
MIWTEHGVFVEQKENVYRICMEKSEGKRLEECAGRWERGRIG